MPYNNYTGVLFIEHLLQHNLAPINDEKEIQTVDIKIRTQKTLFAIITVYSTQVFLQPLQGIVIS